MPTRPKKTIQRRRRAKTWARIAVSAALITWLLSGIGLEQVGTALIKTDLRLMALAMFMMLLDRLLAAYRWYYFARHTTPNIRFANLLEFTLTSAFFGFFVPGTLGVEAIRIYNLKTLTFNLEASIVSVFIERFFALGALLVIVCIGVSFFPYEMPSGVRPIALMTLIGFAFVAACIMSTGIQARFSRFLITFKFPRLAARFSKAAADLTATVRDPRLVVTALLLAFLFQLLGIFRVAIIGYALGIDAPISAYLAFVPIIIFVAQIPVTIAGFGIRESSYVLLFGLIGVGEGQAFTLSILSFALIALTVLAGGLVYLFQSTKYRKTLANKSGEVKLRVADEE